MALEDLRAKETELARARNALNAKRRQLPMVQITNDYAFDGPTARLRLLDLFDGRDQFIAYHFWFQPGEEPCAGCSLWASNLGSLSHLSDGQTSLAMLSLASSGEIEAVKERRGWTMPWYSMVGQEFNTDAGYEGDPQLTVFTRDGDVIYRTYVVSGEALTTITSHWDLLNLTPRGV